MALLHQLWEFMLGYILDYDRIRRDVERTAFVRRFTVLVGPCVDILNNEQEVRLMHKTLETYLLHSPHVQALLPDHFKVTFPDCFELRLSTEVIEAAARGKVLDLDRSMEDLTVGGKSTSSRAPADYRYRRRIERALIHKTWRKRLSLLTRCITSFAEVALQLEDLGKSSYNIVKRALSSYVLVPGIKVPEQAYKDWHWAEQQSFVDLILAVEYDLLGYVEERLQEETRLNEQGWADLIARLITLNSRRPLLSPEVGNRVDLTIRRQRIISVIRPRLSSLGIYLSVAAACMETASIQLVPDDFLCQLVTSSRTLPAQDVETKCEDGDCSHISLHWWLLRGDSSLMLKLILHRCLKAGGEVHGACRENGTALHVLMRSLNRMPFPDIGKFLLLVKLGADPTVRHNGKTPLDEALEERSSMSLDLIKPTPTTNFQELNAAIDFLTYHQTHGLSTHEVNGIILTNMASWEIDESGQLVWDEQESQLI